MDLITIDWTRVDWEKVSEGGKLLLWAGKQLKVWIESRLAVAPPAKATPTRKQKKFSDVAIVVRISRLNVADVRAFLDAQKIGAELVVISNSDARQVVPLPNEPEVWEEMVREFHGVFTAIQSESGAKRFHIFLAAPSALAFAMGCTMSTQYNVHLYQWDPSRQTYVEVIRGTSRERLMSPTKSVANPS